MPPEEQMIVLHLFIPELKAGQPRSPGCLRPRGAEPRAPRDGPCGLHRLRRCQRCQRCGLVLSSLFYRWGNTAGKELEVAEALQDLQLPQPRRYLRAGSGAQQGWEGGAEPRAVPRVPPRSPGAAAPASQTCEKSTLRHGAGREGVKSRESGSECQQQPAARELRQPARAAAGAGALARASVFEGELGGG